MDFDSDSLTNFLSLSFVDAKIIIEGNTLLKVREMLTYVLKIQVNKLVKDRCFFLGTCVFNVFLSNVFNVLKV